MKEWSLVKHGKLVLTVETKEEALDFSKKHQALVIRTDVLIEKGIEACLKGF